MISDTFESGRGSIMKSGFQEPAKHQSDTDFVEYSHNHAAQLD